MWAEPPLWGEPDPPPDSGPGHNWLDREAGPVVRPYAMTGGRVRPAAHFDLVAFVIAEPAADDPDPSLPPEPRAILTMTENPLSVAEIASRLDLPLGVVRVLIGDLLSDGLVALYEPDAVRPMPGENVLKAVIDGLRSL